MAEQYEIVTQRLTSEIVGGHDLVDVWEIGCKTIPHGFYFVFRVGKDRHTPEHVAGEASPRAAELERLYEHPHVHDLAYVQNIGPQGQLVDELDVHYRDADGRSEGIMRVPLRGLKADLLSQHVDEAVAHLNTIRGL